MKPIIIIGSILILLSGCSVKKPEASIKLEGEGMEVPQVPVLLRDKQINLSEEKEPVQQELRAVNDFLILVDNKTPDSLNTTLRLVESTIGQAVFRDQEDRRIVVKYNLGKNTLNLKEDINYRLEYNQYLESASFNKRLSIFSLENESDVALFTDETSRVPLSKNSSTVSFSQNPQNAKFLDSFNGVRRDLIPVSFSIEGRRFSLFPSEERIIETDNSKYLVFLRHSVLQSAEGGAADKVLMEGLPFYCNVSVTKIK